MCLCDVEGLPKPMAACTMAAQDGMIVRTALSSEKAAAAQNATLEFILVNHPLDCPVCDKGGECPLQDLTFRYGPGATRMTFPKRTFDKPIPISPLIALDRERCILCYRCTRFSENVSEDGQLVAVARGAQSMIATFGDEPYRGPFTGNVTELCPVGALTSTQYRFQGRPWEIQHVPSVCGLCPVGCNVDVTIREGKVKRVQSRNHPEVDGGWLCDKGRYVYSHLYAEDRITDPLKRVRRRGLGEISWDDAIDEAERLIRGAEGRIVTALSGSETVEQAYALAKLLRQGVGAHEAVMPEEVSEALDALRLPLSAIADADAVVVTGPDPVLERAPIVDLWIRAARRNGALVVMGDDGKELAREVRGKERVVLVGSGGSPMHTAALAHTLRLGRKEGSGAFHLPETANGRGVAEAWAAASDEEPTTPEPIGLLIVSGDEAAANPAVRALAERAEAVLATTMFHTLAVGWADLVLPGTSYLERDGTYVNLEGRIQRLRRASIPPAPDELAWISKLAERFGVEVSPYPPVVFAEISEQVFGGIPFGEVGERASLPPRPSGGIEIEPAARVATGAEAKPRGPLQLVAYRSLFSGPAVERVPELEFQKPPREVELAPADAENRRIKTGDAVVVSSNGTSVELRARVNALLTPGLARAPREHVPGLQQRVLVKKK
jgi:NADH-quinone oxidoreductase subunit G